MSDNLFEIKEETIPQVDQDKDYWEQLTSEGGKFDKTKYQTEDDLKKALARSKYEADLTVDLYKKRMDQLRTDYVKLHDQHQAGANLTELIDKLQRGQPTNNAPTLRVEDVKEPQKELNVDEIAQRALAILENKTLEDKAKANFNLVQEKLTEQFGNNFQSVVNEHRESLGLSVEDVNSLAKKSPAAFFKVMGFDQQREASFQAPPQSSQRSSFSPRVDRRTWSWYQDLKRKDPKTYHSIKTTNQMAKDYEQLGESFEDGDFKSYGNIK